MTSGIIAIIALGTVLVMVLSARATAAGGGGVGTGGVTGAPPDISSSMINPLDESTWPSGDNIWNVCHAIARQEGYSALVNGQPSNPARLNNPGDLSDGYNTYGGEFHSGSYITHFPTPEIGFQWLYDKIANALSGKSSVYRGSDSFIVIAQHWVGMNNDWKSWGTNVANMLGVDPYSTLQDYVFGA